MSSADQSLKRRASPDTAQEAQQNKRQKPQGDVELSDSFDSEPGNEEAVARVATTEPEEETEEVPGPTRAAQLELKELETAKKDAQKRSAKRRSKWVDTMNKLSTYGNTTGFFSEELRNKGHNSRAAMLPVERQQLMEDLEGGIATSEPQRHNEEDEAQQPKLDLDSMGNFSAVVDSPEDAATFLGINLESPQISSNSQLQLRIDQVQNIALMVKKAEGILKGCVNANDYGTGKSIETLASIFFMAERRQACPTFSDHKATFILCDHQALRGWQEIHANYFSNLLTLYICSRSLPEGNHSRKIDPPEASVLDKFLGSLKPSDPQTSRTIILSTYGEISNRSFLAKRPEKYAREKELSLRGSKLTEEDMEALEVSQKPVLYDLNFNPAMIGTLIADEAHEIKHPKSKKAQAAYLLDADIHFLLTASPVANKISDFRGLLFALYKSNTWQINWPQNEGLEDILEMYDESFDPFESTDSKSFVPPNASPEYKEALRNGHHLWRLNPHAYRWLGHQMDFGPEFSRRVLGSIFRLCLLRRGVVSTVALPSGGSSTISSLVGLPPIVTQTVNVKMTEHGQEDYYDFARRWFDFVFASGADNKAAGAARVINNNETPQAGFNKFYDTSLGHITSDLGLARVLGISPSSSGPPPDDIVPGAEDLIRRNTDAGMSFYYKMTRLDSDSVQPPASRPEMIRHFIRNSPKVQWLLVKLEQLRQKDEKAIIYCVHPLTQWYLEGVCAMADFNFLSLRSKPKHGDRVISAVIDEFNNPDKRVDFLLTTMRVAGSGVDLHADCHNMIIFELPDSIPIILNSIGRIRRVGQTIPQNVWILALDGSYDDFTMYRLSRKYATSLLALGVLGDGLDEVARRVDLQVSTLREANEQSMSSAEFKLACMRRRRDMPTREVTKLLAAGELVRRQLGARHITSFLPWEQRYGILLGTNREGLLNYAGNNMDSNTQIGQLILRQIAQPQGGQLFANMDQLARHLEH